MTLQEYRDVAKLTVEQLCTKLDTPRGTVLGWLYGTRLPSRANIRAIQVATGGAVRFDDWAPLEAPPGG